jgi:NAD+ kinase
LESKINVIGVLAKEGNKEAEITAHNIIDLCLEFGIKTVLLEPLNYKSLPIIDHASDLPKKKVQIIVAIGGDGTILRTLRAMNSEIPILPINVGGKGILSEVFPKDAAFVVKNLIQGNYIFDSRLRINATTETESFPPALNEVFLDRISHTQLPNVMVNKEPDLHFEQRMDGLIISTPTGTTAHSFSGGGPVIHEAGRLLLLTPVCPLSRLPPLILPAEPIKIKFSDDCDLVIDGQEVFKVNHTKTITIRKHEKDAVFVRFNRKGFRQLYNLGIR